MAKADDIVHRMTSTPCFRQRGGRCGVQFALLPRWWRQHITARQARRVGILRSPVGTCRARPTLTERFSSWQWLGNDSAIIAESLESSCTGPLEISLLSQEIRKI